MLNRNLIILMLCEGLAFTLMVVIFTVCAAAGYYMAPHESLALLPLTTEVLGASLATIPATYLMTKLGRRPAFMIGSIMAALGGVVCCIAIYKGSFWLLVAAAPILGFLSGFGEFTRYAAAELYDDPVKKRRAISWIVSSGIIAVFLGPAILRSFNDLFAIQFLGSFVACVFLCLASGVLYSTLKLDLSATQKAPSKNGTLRDVLHVPHFVVGTIAAVVAFLVMAVVMDATPLVMFGCGFSYSDATYVIQWHFLAMFAPSLLTPEIIKRLGSRGTIFLGIGLNAVGIAVALSGLGYGNFLVSLILIGLGWNLMFISGTGLVASVDEKFRTVAEGASNLLIASSFALATPVASVLATTLGWVAVCLFSLLMLGIAFFATTYHRKRLVAL